MLSSVGRPAGLPLGIGKLGARSADDSSVTSSLLDPLASRLLVRLPLGLLLRSEILVRHGVNLLVRMLSIDQLSLT